MVVLQIIDGDALSVTYVKVNPQYHEMCRKVHENHMQGTGSELDEFIITLGGEMNFPKVPDEFGTVITGPEGCTEFLIFWFDG